MVMGRRYMETVLLGLESIGVKFTGGSLWCG